MLGILDGVRVVDLSDSVAGAFAARWLAMLGADVVKVEPPEGDATRRSGPRRDGDPEASALFAYLNAGKRSVVLRPEETAPLLTLLGTADIVIETARPGTWAARGVDFAALRAEQPSLVVCSVTPFGQTGPRAGWSATALTAFAAGGQMMVCGSPEREPLLTAGHQAHYQGALNAFSATLTALYATRRDGVGDHIDISLQEVQAACLEAAGPYSMVRSTDGGRIGNQMRAVWGIYPCADGYVGVAAMARQTPSVYRCIGRGELAEDPAFADLVNNADANEVASTLIAEWASTRTAQQIFEESNAFRAPFSLIPTPRELLDWPPLRAHEFWQEVDHPAIGRHVQPRLPFSIAGERGSTSRAPLLGEHTRDVLAETTLRGGTSTTRPSATVQRPLAGIRVLDLTQVWAGPYAARFLADMGADVIHIEGPAFADAVRVVGRGQHPRWFNASPYFNEYNHNKRGIVLDLHRPEGVEVFRRLARDADVVIENWSVGVAERLGIGWDELRAINPRLVFAQMPGFQQVPPESERVGFGPTIEQMGGLVALQGYEGAEPHKSGISYGDPTAGTTAAGAVVAALIRRDDTGEGSHVVVTQRDNIIAMVGEFMVAESAGLPYPVRIGNRHPDMAPHGVYRTRDSAPRPQADNYGNHIGDFRDTWVAIAVESDAQWHALCGVVDDLRLSDARFATAVARQKHAGEVDAILSEWAAPLDALAAATALQAAGVSAHPVSSALMLRADAHLAARGHYTTTTPHPEVGPYVTMHPTWRMTERPQPPVQPAPCFGQHNREVLREASYTDVEIDALAGAGVLADVPVG